MLLKGMEIKNLTVKEKKALRGLISYPTLNDRQLANKLRLKMSTVTAIRRRLMEKGFFSIVNVPNLPKMGYELFCVEFGTFNTLANQQKILKVLKKEISNDPNVVYCIANINELIIFSAWKNYTDAKTHHEALKVRFNENDILEGDVLEHVIFPFVTTKFLTFFNFLPMLNYLEGKETKTRPHMAIDADISFVKLTRKEKKVLYGLTRYPDQMDNYIAKRLNISRQTVSATRKKLERKGFLSPTIVINPEKLGANMTVFAYSIMGPKLSLIEEAKGLLYGIRNLPITTSIYGNFDSVIMASFKDYRELEKAMKPSLSYYKEKVLIFQPPKTILFPMEGIIYSKPLTFHKLLAQSIEI